MNNKICVYAICKNEMKFVDKWLNSMSEADYIVVLDTGSTDGTYEMLKNDDRVTVVKQQVINPWRFDVARNESLKLVPYDANICCCTDLDEVFEEGWADKLRSKWTSDTYRCFYTYVWSHNEDGSNGYTFSYAKIHNKDYYWKCAVHEYIINRYDEKEDCSVEEGHYIDLQNDVILHHWQDLSKSRSNYLDLIKLRCEEDPTDGCGFYYLAREYSFLNDEENEIKNYLKAIEVFENNPDRRDLFGMHMASCYDLGIIYRNKADVNNALLYFNKAILREKCYREPYLAAAELYNQIGRYEVAIGYVKEALSVIRCNHWSENAISWGVKPYDILTVAYYNTGQMELAKECAAKAYELSPDDERIAKNYNIICGGNIDG